MTDRAAIFGQLTSALADLYDDEASAHRLARAAGLDPSTLAWQPKAINNWDAIFEAAAGPGQVERLLAAAAQEYPIHPPHRVVPRSRHVMVICSLTQARLRLSSRGFQPP